MRARLWRFVAAALVASLATASSSSPITGGEATSGWAGPTCERSGRGCSERERAFLYHWMAKQRSEVRAEAERLVQLRSLGEALEPARQEWADQRLHILNQLGVHKDEL
jgi:hypothetical protein